MIQKWWKPLAFGVTLILVGHLLAIGLLPSFIMSIAIKRVGEQAGGVNRLFHSPRVTAKTQRIVRSSPDLAYSSCALDLSRGPVRAQIAPGADYVSVSLYAANTDNVFALNDQAMGPAGAKLFIVSARSPIAAAPGETVVNLPSDKGILLVRRLAPSQAAFEAADVARQTDFCRSAI